MAELVDALVSDASEATHVSSNLINHTNMKKTWLCQVIFFNQECNVYV